MSMVRQPVPGVHDLISPEGRVCVEILDDRGRVVQKVKSDNAIMNFWNESMKRYVRGADQNFWPQISTTTMGYHFHGHTVSLATEKDAGRTLDQWWQFGLAEGWPVLGHPSNFADGMRNVILSDSTEAVNADEFIFPGEMGAYTNLREQYAPAVNTKRGNLNTVTSYRTTTSLRYVSEWGTAYGNGTHNSVGIGNVVQAATAATHSYQCLTPYLSFSSRAGGTTIVDSSNGVGAAATIHNSHPVHGIPNANVFAAAGLPANINTPILSGYRAANNEFWTVQSGIAGNNLSKKDFSNLSAAPFSAATAAAGHAVTGPTNTTIGGGTTKTAVAAIGADLWLAYQGTLKRCVKPTNTSLTVTNTYTPGGIENCVDMCTDDTNLYWLGATTVYVIDPATGTVSSSWAHGLTGTMGTMVWGGVNSPYLIISYEATSLPSVSTTVGISARSSWLAALRTTAGVAKGTFQIPSCVYSGSANTSYTSGGLIMPLTGDRKHWIGPAGAHAGYTSTPQIFMFGPSHMSRTVLGSPVVKTAANSMRVTYEFTF